MKKLLLLGFLISITAICAQNIMMLGSGSTDKLQMMPALINDSIFIDTSKVLVKYRFRKTNMQNKEQDIWCDIRMQIGAAKVKQDELHYYYGNLVYTSKELNGEFAESVQTSGRGVANLFSEIICNLTNNEMSVVCGDFFYVDKMKTYTQPIPSIHWVVKDNRKEILGYQCQEAIANFSGRTWQAWFSTDIPISVGPWKLNGLPGLVLAATDGKDYSFVCTEILKAERPMYKYVYGSLQDIKSLKNYLQYERRCYEHPYQVFANGQEAMIVTKGADGKMKYLDESWTIPYNPIELE